MSYGHASVTSDRSNGAAGVGAQLMDWRASIAVEGSKRMQRNYEYKIATLHSRVATLEREVEDGREREQKWVEGEAWERAREKEAEALQTRVDNDELRILPDRCEELEAGRAGGGQPLRLNPRSLITLKKYKRKYEQAKMELRSVKDITALPAGAPRG
ncbi:hypothetical protein POSPLADRAFT_1061762 [Postia placenta MAD-698-R-SB12]|uniref:Uncharacterized protein n=1 Tax=Postia placenta MAD-698-R-SB12 TaxID=670580 RepID=A0A1X6MMN1_9APHY|nr:hypothetical protein POSPLADRAFT_1061762 [Postia placenta MAD-698-R-SB12]OSX57529.1 hypothetical protein POSPLADRAFT_1061762 [Postia placenta MAD-698-R-SB12]